MKKIYIKKSGTMGMGTGSDTRMYAPRSESSHMYRANNEDEYTYTGVEDPKYRDEFADKKKKERKARADEMKNLKHLSITTEDIAENDDDEDEDKFNPREGGREPSLQTGTSGNFGALTSLAMQARGPGFAGGEGVEGYKYSSEPMESAWSEILKATPRRSGGGKSSRAPPRTTRFGKVRQQRPAPKPRNINVPTRQQQTKPVPFNPNDLPVAPEEPVIGDPTMPYGKPMIPGDARMDMNPTMPPQQPNKKEVSDEQRERLMRQIREMEQNIHPTMDRPGSIDIPPEERDKYLTMQGYYPEVRTGEPMLDAWSEMLKSKKSKKKDRKAKKEQRKKWRPSTGMFKKPPGGFDISGATNRRAKARMRGIKGGKRTGLGRAHLSVEMGHRTVGRNKQPTSKDVGKYRQYLGQQEAQRRLGNIRSPTSIPQRFGARSYRAGSTGGGALRQLPGQAALARRPAIRRPTRPRMMPARGVRRPVMPRAPRMPNVPSPQYQSGYANQSMAGGAQYMPSRMPSASVQGGPSMVMTSKVGVGSDLQKRGMSYYDTSELRQLINEARQALKRKESKKKGMGSKDTGGAGSNLPRHNNAPTKETTNPTGATEDANNDPRTFGVNPLDHLTGKGGRTP